jgi:DNA polymerase-3 subunit alpha/error-prone DNA polymerase
LNELVQLAKACEVNAMALTDINTVTGIYDFIKECKANEIKPMVGMEFRESNQLFYIALAKNRAGLAEICGLRTTHNLNKTLVPKTAPNFAHVIVIYPIENVPDCLQEHEYIGLLPEQITKLIQPLWKNKIQKMVVLQPVTFRVKKEFNLHKILRAIDTNVILSKLTKNDYCHTSEKMILSSELMALYKHYPQIITNTQQVINNCNFEFEFKTHKNKKYYTNMQKTSAAAVSNNIPCN